MLYIHDLKSLNIKSANLESVYLIREIKNLTNYPLSEEKVGKHFYPFFVSDTDEEKVGLALEAVEPTLELVKRLQQEENPNHEPINVKRVVQILQEMGSPLNNNLNYLREIKEMQAKFAGEMTLVLNQLPRIKTNEDKVKYNQPLDQLFQLVLRNKEFSFNFNDVVNEAQLNHIKGLGESLDKGFLFHITLEEELRKLKFEAIKGRFSKKELEEAEELRQKVRLIEEGIERAYKVNMNMINWSVLLYSYVKWLASGGK